MPQFVVSISYNISNVIEMLFAAGDYHSLFWPFETLNMFSQVGGHEFIDQFLPVL